MRRLYLRDAAGRRRRLLRQHAISAIFLFCGRYGRGMCCILCLILVLPCFAFSCGLPILYLIFPFTCFRLDSPAENQSSGVRLSPKCCLLEHFVAATSLSLPAGCLLCLLGYSPRPYHSCTHLPVPRLLLPLVTRTGRQEDCLLLLYSLSSAIL